MFSPSCPCTGTTLTKLIQPAVLTVLSEGPLHGYRIAKRLGDFHISKGRKPDPTGVYRTLKSMEHRELVSSSWDLAAGGPPKRLYRLTKSGRQCLAQWVLTLEEYQKAIEELLTAAKALVGTTRNVASRGKKTSQ